jgi:hypothetical protein
MCHPFAVIALAPPPLVHSSATSSTIVSSPAMSADQWQVPTLSALVPGESIPSPLKEQNPIVLRLSHLLPSVFSSHQRRGTSYGNYCSLSRVTLSSRRFSTNSERTFNTQSLITTAYCDDRLPEFVMRGLWKGEVLWMMGKNNFAFFKNQDGGAYNYYNI